jgi:hypothetical protein
MASSSIGVAGSWLLLGRLGLLAVPVGAIAGEGVACYHFVIRDTCRALGDNYTRFALRLWPGILLIATASLAVGWLGHAIAAGPAMLRWLETGMLTTSAAAGTAWLVIGTADRRAVVDLSLRRFPALRRNVARTCQLGF